MVLVLVEDIRQIAEAEGRSDDDVVAQYCDKSHALTERAGRPITQLRAIAGRCVFLGGDAKCSIHDYKPLQCRLGPDRFLSKAMHDDYECMKHVETLPGDDLTEHFFIKLMEE